MSMKIKEDSVKMSEPAQDHDISALFETNHGIDPAITAEKLRKKDLKDKTPLLEFMNKHCQRSPYAFQVKKCSDDTCSYCKAHPIHVTYLPLSLLDTSKANYQPFENRANG